MKDDRKYFGSTAEYPHEPRRGGKGAGTASDNSAEDKKRALKKLKAMGKLQRFVDVGVRHDWC